LVIFLLSIVVTFVCCISELFFFGLDIVNIKANVVEVDCVVVPEILKFSAGCDRFQCLPGALVTSN